jgi:hypothetical protein
MQTLPAGIDPLLGYDQKADPKHSQRGALSPLIPGENIPESMGDDFSESMGEYFSE